MGMLLEHGFLRRHQNTDRQLAGMQPPLDMPVAHVKGNLVHLPENPNTLLIFPLLPVKYVPVRDHIGGFAW